MTLIIAHRGLARQHPENTMPAFIAALDLGADGLETDVQETADHHLILCHDDRVDRTTNGFGRVSQLTLAQVQRLDAGCRFYGHKTSIKIPTLMALLKQLQERHFSGVLNIELKSQLHNRQDIVMLLIDQLQQFPDLANQIVISSFSAALLKTFQLKSVQRAVQPMQTALLIRWRINSAQQLLQQQKITSVHPKWWLLFWHYRWLIRHAQVVRLWTVNRTALLRWSFDHNVAAVITDEVELALLFQKRQQQK